jgi:hypothetical protein
LKIIPIVFDRKPVESTPSGLDFSGYKHRAVPESSREHYEESFIKVEKTEEEEIKPAIDLRDRSKRNRPTIDRPIPMLPPMIGKSYFQTPSIPTTAPKSLIEPKQAQEAPTEVETPVEDQEEKSKEAVEDSTPQQEQKSTCIEGPRESLKPSALRIGTGEVRYGLMMPGPKGSVYRTYDTHPFRKALRQTTKELLPRFDFWKTHCTTKMVIADFDYKPADFESWGDFRQYLRWKYPNGIVTTSPSGKAKIFFKIEVPSELSLIENKYDDDRFATDILRETLRTLLNDEELYQLADKSGSALRVCFMTNSMYHTIVDHIDLLPAYAATLDMVPDEEETEYSHHLWRTTEPDNPHLTELLSTPDLKFGEYYLIQWISGWSKQALTPEGIQIPQPYVAHCSTIDPHASTTLTLNQIHYALHSLIRRGWLSVVSHSYQLGKKSKTYVVAGTLRSIIKKILCEFLEAARSKKSEKNPLRDGRTIVLNINDGEWNQILWKMTNYFGCYASFMEWFHNLPGWNRKDRLRQAENAWYNHIKLDLAFKMV